MTLHALGQSPSGLLARHYDDEREAIILTAPSAVMWRFHLDGQDGLDALSELLDAWLEKATREDIRWMVDTIQSVETWLEHCPHDLRTYGQVGVTA